MLQPTHQNFAGLYSAPGSWIFVYGNLIRMCAPRLIPHILSARNPKKTAPNFLRLVHFGAFDFLLRSETDVPRLTSGRNSIFCCNQWTNMYRIRLLPPLDRVRKCTILTNIVVTAFHTDECLLTFIFKVWTTIREETMNPLLEIYTNCMKLLNQCSCINNSVHYKDNINVTVFRFAWWK